MMLAGSVFLSVFLSLFWRNTAAPQLSLVPLRISLANHQQSESFNIVRPNTPIGQFFPHNDVTYVREPPSEQKKRRKVVRLETKQIPFSLLEDMKREMFHSEAAKIIEKGSNFVQALRYQSVKFF